MLNLTSNKIKIKYVFLLVCIIITLRLWEDNDTFVNRGRKRRKENMRQGRPGELEWTKSNKSPLLVILAKFPIRRNRYLFSKYTNKQGSHTFSYTILYQAIRIKTRHSLGFKTRCFNTLIVKKINGQKFRLKVNLNCKKRW